MVEGPRIEKMLGYTNLESEKGFAFFQRFLKDTGILEELEAAGIQEGDTVRQFVTKTLDPLENLDNFKICLTRLWFNTDVLVEWSMPPGMTENL